MSTRVRSARETMMESVNQHLSRRALVSAWIAAPAIVIGAAVLFTPLFPWLWGLLPGVGPVIAAFAVGTGLVLHGVFSVLRVFKGDSDERLAAVLTAVASLLVGAVAFSWPVLTLVIFRLAIGAWLIFFGLRTLTNSVTHRVARHRHSAERPRRRWLQTVGAALSLALAVLIAFGSNLALGGVGLPVPGPFYALPEGDLEDLGAPGTLIRSEPLITGVPQGATAWKILYTTTSFDGSAAVSSGTVVVPTERGRDPLPLLTVSHGTTGVATGCAPSLSQTPFADGASAALETMVVDHGWAAVTSDYIGLGTSGTHPYLIGDAEARNVLDASRAALQLDTIALDTRTVVWGHSQGGQGALWTGQIAEAYAPELTVEGIAAFAPASDLFRLADANKNDAAGKVVSAYIAATWGSIFPELQLEQQLTPGSAGGVRQIQGLCFNGLDVISAALSGTQIPNQLFPDRALDGAFGDLLKQQEPVGPFPAPLLVAQGEADTLVKPQLQRDWVAARCSSGTEVDYREFPGLGHVDLVGADSPLTPQLIAWTLDRWSGEAPTPNCAND